ncbi:hypothetical protein I4F81_006572 [Pyropia yezoensis]|uniref:Uncharacterized protein n=1 Tax=Pyropia yezoensis TaxID=2788 RepID=A0ACC3C2N5_PYRYE|nr:hypothetical protein I4F81_006572 [Neopyropia yezoensis]
MRVPQHVSSVRSCDVRDSRSSSVVFLVLRVGPNVLASVFLYIVSAARTPIGSFLGSLRGVPAVELAAVAIRGALDRTRLPSSAVGECVLGNVLGANTGQAPARQAALAASLPVATVCTTVNKVCASGLKAVGLAADSLALGRGGAAGAAVAGGAESMSRAPHYLEGLRGSGRGGGRFGWPTVGDRPAIDAINRDGLTDGTLGAVMGSLADALAAEQGISREEQDHHATHSYSRAAKAAHAGLFADEIVAVKAADGSVALGEDEEVHRFTSYGLSPVARIVAYADAEGPPEAFPTAPIPAVHAALARAGLSVGDVDVWEVNEAFSAAAVAVNRGLGLEATRVNVRGGAVAMGHPIGASGARILVTLLSVLKERGGAYGVAAVCNGGGGASALVVQRIP